MSIINKVLGVFLGDKYERDMKEIMPFVEKLDFAWRIEEQPFRSKVPFLGYAIAALRTAWNSISTKWI